jgi:hypothetical protein
VTSSLGRPHTLSRHSLTKNAIEHYIAQKAQQALEALTSADSLKDRLEAARDHFRFVTRDHYLSSCPETVRDCLIAVRDIANDESLPSLAHKIRTAIETIFEEFGKQDAVDGKR